MVDRHPTATPSVGFDDLDAAVASMQVRPSGTIVLADDFSDPDFGVMPKTSPDPNHYQVAYRPGAYEFVDVDPTWNGTAEALFGGFLPFPRIAVDVTFTTDEYGQLAYIGWRHP